MKAFQTEMHHPFECLVTSGKIYVNFGSVYALNSQGDCELIIPQISSGELSRDFLNSPSYIDIKDSFMGAVCLNINCDVGFVGDDKGYLFSDNKTLSLWSRVFDNVFYKSPALYRDYAKNYITKQESGLFVKDLEIFEPDFPWSFKGITGIVPYVYQLPPMGYSYINYHPLVSLTPPTASDGVKAYIDFFEITPSNIENKKPWEFFEDKEEFNFLHAPLNGSDDSSRLRKTIPIALFYSGDIIQLLDIDYFFCFFRDFKKKFVENFLENQTPEGGE